MAKTGLTQAQCRGLLRKRAQQEGWVLCIGAGVSRPVFPDWAGLVHNLIERDLGTGSADQLLHLRTRFSADAFIQAATDRLGLSDEAFAEILCEELYSHVRSKLTAVQWQRFVEIMDSRHLGRATLAQWMAFRNDVQNVFPDSTAIGIAATIADVIETAYAPTAILSFNAEPMLAALINANVAIRRSSSSSRDVMDYVTHATSDRKQGRVPYVFCHGLLPIPEVDRNHSLSSVDKLVFSEASYLNLANSAFSWQSASFLRAAALHSLVFVGVSLSDPNMRRWLSWVHSVRVAELTEVGAPSPTSTVHYWITRQAGSAAERKWTESLVSHLGVRIIWVSEFSEISARLRTMLSLAPL